MADLRTNSKKRARSSDHTPPARQQKRPARPLYKDHEALCALLAISPRDKVAGLLLRREAQDICREEGYELNRNYTSWEEDEMERLVKTVTAKMNASAIRKTVFPAAAIDALLHRICLDNDADPMANAHGEDKESKSDPLLNEKRDDDTPMPVRGVQNETPLPLRLQANDIPVLMNGPEAEGVVPLAFQEDDLSVFSSGPQSDNPVPPPVQVQKRDIHIPSNGCESDDRVPPPQQECDVEISLGAAEGDGSVPLPLEEDDISASLSNFQTDDPVPPPEQKRDIHISLGAAGVGGSASLSWQEDDIWASLSGPESDDPVPPAHQERDMHISQSSPERGGQAVVDSGSVSGPESDGQTPTPRQERDMYLSPGAAECGGSIPLPLQEDDVSTSLDGPESNDPVPPAHQERNMHISPPPLQENNRHLSPSGPESDRGQANILVKTDSTISEECKAATQTVDIPGSSIPSFDPKTSILITFIDNTVPPMIVVRGKPFHWVFFQMLPVLKVTTDQQRLVAYVQNFAGPSELFIVDSEKTWRRLADDTRIHSVVFGAVNLETGS
ncbi:hypothetical protein FN846DRAFT_892736 [Sphaerosporella brunnea]|uniref:Uncharacterized protein n=1 Tax=Sphaerosporella brunnea TaxID=1250544 RepID=A0A5J5EP32_9PEZI|nr:hypothetical protein FN846DRAFT_892736 [Sphaerosporella brunnea]